ncbi:hypothetical protein Tco_0109979, partial [Tanacetum coccineum]
YKLPLYAFLKFDNVELCGGNDPYYALLDSLLPRSGKIERAWGFLARYYADT